MPSLAWRLGVWAWQWCRSGGRRNLTDGWKYELAQTRKAVLAQKGREKLSEAGKAGREKQLGGLSTPDKGPEHNTQQELAKELGWSTGKVALQGRRKWKSRDESEPDPGATEARLVISYWLGKLENKASGPDSRGDNLSCDSFVTVFLCSYLLF